MRLPNGLVSFGTHANCTLDLCPIETSILQYQPSIPGNAVVLGLFALSALLHIVQGVKSKSWDFMICMVIGCLDEIIGYIGRLMLNNNPFSFTAFIMQTVCITTAPIFFCSAIYVMLSRTIVHLDGSVSRFNPKLLVWFFIPCDIVSLICQATGGALSSIQAGTGNNTGVDVSEAGLILQVATLAIFIGIFVDYVLRFGRRSQAPPLQTRMKIFLAFLLLSILFILARCAFRIDELSEGYSGDLMHDEVLFMVLEAAMMLIAVFCLHIGHPSVAFDANPYKAVVLNSVASEEVIMMTERKNRPETA